MDVLATVQVNGVSYPVTNDSDYYFDGHIYSSYGFELFFLPVRGLAHLRQDRWLTDNGFVERSNMFNKSDRGTKYWNTESRIDTLNVLELVEFGKFVVEWVEDCYMTIGFDTREFVVQCAHGNLYLPDVIF
jgi:hypothetical protein